MTMPSPSLKVLFTGYAPVHFLCFRPLFQKLQSIPGVEVFLSGGIREFRDEGYLYHLNELYGPFGIPAKHLLTVGAIQGMDFDLLFGANSKLILPGGVRAKVQVFHGISFRNRAVRSRNLGADFYFLAGPYMRRKFLQANLFVVEDPRALPVGFMKTDCLLDGSLDRKEILTSIGLQGERPVLIYAPTGQEGNSLETMGVEPVRLLMKTGMYDIIVKLHDHPHGPPGDGEDRLKAMEDGHMKVVAQNSDVCRLLFASDLLITDASSVSSEYSLLDRPMVFLDVPDLLEQAASKGRSMMDLNTWGRRAGTVVQDPADIVDAVEKSLENPRLHSEIRRAMAADLFFNPGTATNHALHWLQERFLDPLPSR